MDTSCGCPWRNIIYSLAGRAGFEWTPPVGARGGNIIYSLAGRAGFEPAAEVLAPALT